MLTDRRTILEDEPCPVPDEMLGEIYSASPHGLNELIATVTPTARALLALYCYRRTHLASIGLAIAATCEEADLAQLGGNAGAVLFERSREAPRSSLTPNASGKRTNHLSTGPLRHQRPFADMEDLLDDAMID